MFAKSNDCFALITIKQGIDGLLTKGEGCSIHKIENGMAGTADTVMIGAKSICSIEYTLQYGYMRLFQTTAEEGQSFRCLRFGYLQRIASDKHVAPPSTTKRSRSRGR